jgi:hypothetical protein
MAQLPPDGTWLIQQTDGVVHVFHRWTEEKIVSFSASDADAIAKAQKTIHDAPQLTDEAKCFAHFWSGYFYAYSGNEEPV